MSGFLSQIFRRDYHLAIALCLLALAAWLRVVWTGNLKVDENFVWGFRSGVLIFLVLAGLGLAWRSVDRPVAIHVSQTSLLTATILSWICPPFLSNDVFSYFYYGEALRAGLPVYESFDGSSLNWFPYVGQRYLTTPAVYGLPLLGLYGIIDNLSSSDAGSALLLLKVVHALGWVFLYAALERRFPLKPIFWLRPALPLIMVEGLANLHNEFLLLPLIAWAFVFIERRCYLPAFLLMGLATWCKLSFGLFFLWPFFQPERPYTNFRFWKGLGIALMALGIISLVSWHSVFPTKPFRQGLLSPITTVSSLGPSSSLSDLVFTLIRITAGPESAQTIQSFLGKALQIFSIVLLGAIFRNPIHRQNPYALWLITTVFVCFFSHRIMAWYFLMMVPLWWPGLPTVWSRWFSAITAFYMAQGLIQYTHPDLHFTKALTGVLVGLGLIWLLVNFRKRFWGINSF